jgi:hypothetical protein
LPPAAETLGGGVGRAVGRDGGRLVARTNWQRGYSIVVCHSPVLKVDT